MFPRDLVSALWDLVRNGEVSNDTLLPLRSHRRVASKQKASIRGRRRSRLTQSRSRLQGTQGRWWLVASCLHDEPDLTSRGLAICTTLLDRYGVLCREAFGAENIRGGFSKYYPVLKALEERGKVRRGFYVDRLGATQFAIPGVGDQLRQDTPISRPIWLSILDPVQPHGAILPWPDDFPIRPTRNAGARACFVDGAIIATISSCGSKLLMREPDDASQMQRRTEQLIEALRMLPQLFRQKRSSSLRPSMGTLPASSRALQRVPGRDSRWPAAGFNCGLPTTRMRRAQSRPAARSADIQRPQ